MQEVIQEASEKPKRLSVEKCREVLGDDVASLSDIQIEDVRDALYMLGENILDNLFNPSSVCHDHE